MFDTIFGFAWNTYQIVKTTNGGGPILSVEKRFNNFPSTNELEQNYPNPFNSTTNIRYQIAKNSYIVLKIYDILGREVATLVNKNQTTGIYEEIWNASNFTSGVYFYSLFVDGIMIDAKKLLLIK